MALKFRDDLDLSFNELLNASLLNATISASNLGDVSQHSNVDISGIVINQTIVWDGTKLIPGTAISGSHIILDEGTPLPARPKLNFVGPSITITDDFLNNATIVTVANSGHTIQDEGIVVPARTHLNFIGVSVSVTDDAFNDATVIGFGGGGSSFVDSLNGITNPGGNIAIVSSSGDISVIASDPLNTIDLVLLTVDGGIF